MISHLLGFVSDVFVRPTSDCWFRYMGVGLTMILIYLFCQCYPGYFERTRHYWQRLSVFILRFPFLLASEDILLAPPKVNLENLKNPSTFKKVAILESVITKSKNVRSFCFQIFLWEKPPFDPTCFRALGHREWHNPAIFPVKECTLPRLN